MFEFGFYEKEITPPLGCNMPGYGNVRPGQDVLDRLYARAAVIKEGNEAVALISVDSCTVENELVDVIADRIREYTGIPRKNVVVAYTHTHTGTPRFGTEGDENTTRNEEGYHIVMSKWVADCAILAYKRLKKCTIHYGVGQVEGISFCRDYYMKNSTPRTNPPRTSPDIIGPCGETDNDLPVLLAKDEAGNPMGAIISFACHLDCVGGEDYSGDYVSILAKELKKAYGEDFVTVFLQGCSGNINHFDVSKETDAPDHYVMMGRKIAKEAITVAEAAQQLEQSGLRTAFEVLSIDRLEVSPEKIAEAEHAVATIKKIEGIKIAADGTAPEQYLLMMSKSLLAFLKNTPDVIPIPVQVIAVGELKIYAFPTEIFSYFGKYVKQQDGGKCIVATLCNASRGYVTTPDLHYDTIYESRPGATRMQKEAGQIMADKLLEMGKTL